jgi:hypothetical protein
MKIFVNNNLNTLPLIKTPLQDPLLNKKIGLLLNHIFLLQKSPGKKESFKDSLFKKAKNSETPIWLSLFKKPNSITKINPTPFPHH